MRSSSFMRNGILFARPDVSGVRINPGWTIVTETPSPERSSRTLSKNAVMPALLAEYAADLGSPRNPARLETATICPDRLLIMSGTTA